MSSTLYAVTSKSLTKKNPHFKTIALIDEAHVKALEKSYVLEPVNIKTMQVKEAKSSEEAKA